MVKQVQVDREGLPGECIPTQFPPVVHFEERRKGGTATAEFRDDVRLSDGRQKCGCPKQRKERPAHGKRLSSPTQSGKNKGEASVPGSPGERVETSTKVRNGYARPQSSREGRL